MRRSVPNASQSTLSIIGVITEFRQSGRPAAMSLVSKTARVLARHRAISRDLYQDLSNGSIQR